MRLAELFRHSRSLIYFILIPAASAVSPVLILPAISATYGLDGFGAIAIGQAVGAGFAVVCELGWSVVGPQAVARLSRAEACDLYRASVASKLAVFVPFLPVCASVAYICSPEYSREAALMAASALTYCLSASWFLTGLNRPLAIMAVEVIPRIVLNVVVALALLNGAALVSVSLVNVLSLALGLILLRHIFGVSSRPTGVHFRMVGRMLREQWRLCVGRGVASLYSTMVAPLVGVLAPSSVGVFAGVDRILRMELLILSGVPSRLQSWLGSSARSELVRRCQMVLAANFVLGLASGGALTLLGPLAARLLFAGQLSVPTLELFLAAGICWAICASRGLGLVLVAVGRADAIMYANLGAACVAICTIAPLVDRWGAAGAFACVLSAEVVGALVQGRWVLSGLSRQQSGASV